MKRLHGSYGAANLSLEAEKDAVRKRMRALRKCLTAALPSWSAGVRPALLQDANGSPADQGRVIAAYAPQGSELDPYPIVKAFMEMGWTSSLPRAADRDSPLSFHAASGPLGPDAFGIPAPPPTSPRLTPDLVIAPVLAFDRTGGRLGQGGGCYDRTITELRATRPVRVIGLAYDEQEVERVPIDEHDEPLDGILTPTGFIEVVHPRS